MTNKRSTSAVWLVLCGCTNAGLAWAPRHPGPERPPRPIDGVAVVEIGSPDCDHRVIGTAFGTSVEELRETAAQHGGDGVYDTSCVVQTVDHVYFAQVHGQCDGRVYVCAGPAKAKAAPTPPAEGSPPADPAPAAATAPPAAGAP